VTNQAEQREASDPVEAVPEEWLSDAEVVPELQRLDRLVARAQARAARVIAMAHRRGLPRAQGFGSSTAWLIATTGQPPAVCRSRVRVSLALRHMAATAQAFTAGDLSEPRVRLLVEAREAAPEIFARDEGLLVSQARSLSARVFPKALAHWHRLADPDGALAEARKAFEQRRLCVSATWDNRVRLDGDLDPESGSVVMKAIGSLADPWALDRGDLRTPHQRRADALVEICRRHLDSGNSPQQGGEKPHVTLTVSLKDLQADGVVDLEAGPIPAESARRLACDAAVWRILMAADGRPAVAGAARRTIPSGLRRALDLRDGGCTHPGCDVPPAWCDAHHIIHWAHGGKTELENLRLLCRRHHGWAHDDAPHPRRE